MNRETAEKIETIIRALTGPGDRGEPLTGIDISEQFRPEEVSPAAIAANLNAAFLIVLSGGFHPLYREAEDYIRRRKADPSWREAVEFYDEGPGILHSEIADACSRERRFEEELHRLYSWIRGAGDLTDRKETIKRLWAVFFPEGLSLCEERERAIGLLREKRRVDLTGLNPSPIRDPAREVLFTSNVLLTIPSRSVDIDELPFGTSLREGLKRAVEEEQLYWYDHPIQIGVERERNEVIYGLTGLDEAVAFEKERGTVDGGARLSCLLSVSVTHRGLQGIAKEYLEGELRRSDIRHLDLYIFTEAETSRLLEEVLIPAAERYMEGADCGLLREVIGVDGEYGRHYSFLKAIAALWQVLVDQRVRGTFKIDLDQVFPQRELVEQSGASAFEHLKTPLWGAEGIESGGGEVELGMIAGALVNKADIATSLYTPDVCLQERELTADELVFFSRLPQALSTEAEMMTRYRGEDIDGERRCIQRVHVTGGTCGILVRSLRRHRPFTPTFIGRAEDQAYLLSVLFKGRGKRLRYVHKDGLIMRHDKEAFAGEAIRTAYAGKLIGDYARGLWFTFYARALPWPLEETKKVIDPFTGCFVSSVPFTLAYLRLALKAASFFKDGKDQEGLELLQIGTRRLHRVIGRLLGEPEPLTKAYQRERDGWEMYYDVLDRLEEGLHRGDAFALEIRRRARGLIEDCRMNLKA